MLERLRELKDAWTTHHKKAEQDSHYFRGAVDAVDLIIKEMTDESNKISEEGKDKVNEV